MNKNRLIRKRLMALTISACCLVGLCGQIPAALSNLHLMVVQL